MHILDLKYLNIYMCVLIFCMKSASSFIFFIDFANIFHQWTSSFPILHFWSLYIPIFSHTSLFMFCCGRHRCHSDAPLILNKSTVSASGFGSIPRGPMSWVTWTTCFWKIPQPQSCFPTFKYNPVPSNIWMGDNVEDVCPRAFPSSGVFGADLGHTPGRPLPRKRLLPWGPLTNSQVN